MILLDIYSHFCLTDESVRAALIATGPRPFKLHCLKPWGCVPSDPDTITLHHTAARADISATFSLMYAFVQLKTN